MTSGNGGNIEIVAGAVNAGAAGAGAITNLGALTANGKTKNFCCGNGGNITVATGLSMTITTDITANGGVDGGTGGNVIIISPGSITHSAGNLQTVGMVGNSGNLLLSGGTNYNVIAAPPECSTIFLT